ncbi:TIGR03086 family metal-binding protein [Modestobacter sp. Leaf380]|uniref:TIGR03086 family metal-binding protein n=1 Tax=Modestobacter sp. Leaf380 TaxID=1736356 RepID=UPI0006FF763B|nr:TIGR03086 family metal-binding protein [Modestobacter sp. Leaf380]KQS73367.1 hypothetical protein ASG41_01480 [Modestobacter sp. Leaf380]
MDRTQAELIERLQRAQAQFTDRVDAVEAGGWDAVVLPGWTVADLVAHATRQQLLVPALLAGATAAGSALPVGTEELLDGDPLGSWEDAADHALTAAAQPDALDATLADGGPATDLLVELTTDLTVHAWDVARATGGDTELDGELVSAALLVSELRGVPDGPPAHAGEPVAVPADADPQTRLLARWGRRG